MTWFFSNRMAETEVAALDIQAMMFGPLLWTISISGISLNMFVISSNFYSIMTASSILLGTISFLLVLKATLSLLLLDFVQGEFHELLADE